MRPCAMAFSSVVRTCSWPISSANVCGRYFLAMTWYMKPPDLARRLFSPQLRRRAFGAFSQRGQLHPGKRRINRAETGEGAESTVAAGDHPLAPHNVRILENAL